MISLEGLEFLPRLSSLICRGNRLQGVLDFPCPEGAHGLAGVSVLRHADLRNNAISGAISLPVSAGGRPIGVDAHLRLETLLLDHNKLRSLRGVEVLEHLAHFSVSSNQLQDTAGAGALIRVRTLDLSKNTLTTCHELGEMVALQSCHLQKNRLTRLPSLAKLKALSDLDLSSNNLPDLEALTSAIGGAKSRLLQVSPLATLDVRGNPLLAAEMTFDSSFSISCLTCPASAASLPSPTSASLRTTCMGRTASGLRRSAALPAALTTSLTPRNTSSCRRCLQLTAIRFAPHHEPTKPACNTLSYCCCRTLTLSKRLYARMLLMMTDHVPLCISCRSQYTKAFKERRVADEHVAKGAGFWR